LPDLQPPPVPQQPLQATNKNVERPTPMAPMRLPRVVPRRRSALEWFAALLRAAWEWATR
jgi:hypothetical protein